MGSISAEKTKHMHLNELFEQSPLFEQYFEEQAIKIWSPKMTVQELLDSLSGHWLRDHGLDKEMILNSLSDILDSIDDAEETFQEEITSIKVCAGTDKDGRPEQYSISIERGETVCICGATGSGKTRFLEDIEYIACGDSPTERIVMVNGRIPEEEMRCFLESRLCARLSQSMNFVLELTCHDFIFMHTKCRNNRLAEEDIVRLEEEVMACANSLAGECFDKNTMITELSGGQSRALMIADLAYISNAPVILIDEPENAGIDRDHILELLSSKGKIVLVSTHDPLIALSCRKRIVVKNGAVSTILERTREEEKLLRILREQDKALKKIRQNLREGKHVGENEE